MLRIVNHPLDKFRFTNLPQAASPPSKNSMVTPRHFATDATLSTDGIERSHFLMVFRESPDLRSTSAMDRPRSLARALILSFKLSPPVLYWGKIYPIIDVPPSIRKGVSGKSTPMSHIIGSVFTVCKHKMGADLYLYEKIKELAHQNGKSLAQIEKEMELPRGSIKNLKKHSPSVDGAVKFADYFGVSIDHIMGRNTVEDDDINAMLSDPEYRALFKKTAKMSKADLEFVKRLIDSIQVD